MVLGVMGQNTMEMDDEPINKMDQFKFLSFVAQFGKNYKGRGQFIERLRNWKKNDGLIKRAVDRTFEIAHNMYSDWSDEEWDEFLSLRDPWDPSRNHRNLRDDYDFDDEHRLLQSNYNCGEGEYYFWRWNRCRSCTFGCKTCRSGRDCQECMDPVMIMDGEYCMCPKGFIETPDGMCEEDAIIPDVICEYGFINVNDMCVCPEGSHQHDNECVECETGEEWNGESCVQLECPSRHFRAEDGTCEPCGEFCGSCDDITGRCRSCIHGSLVFDMQADVPKKCQCFSGKKFINGKCEYFSSCEDGQFKDYFTQKCRDCDITCNKCADDWGHCYDCKANYEGKRKRQCSCPTGMTDWGNGQGCGESCGSSQFMTEAGTCEDCGQYCLECSPKHGTCEMCEDSKMMLLNPMNNRDCMCPEGHEYSEGDCVRSRPICADGEFVNKYFECQPCEENCAVCEDGYGRCQVCDPLYQMRERSNSCVCRVDQIDNGVTCQDKEDLVECDFGSYRTDENTCKACAKDCYACEDITQECLQCKDGFQQVGAECIPCAPGYMQSGDDCLQVACPGGTFRNSDGECQECYENCGSCHDITGDCRGCIHHSLVVDYDNRKICTCFSGEKFIDGECQYYSSCPDGAYLGKWDNDAWDRENDPMPCTTCGKTCNKCADMWGHCYECKERTSSGELTGYVVGPRNPRKECICPANYVDDGEKCVFVKKECPEGQYTDFRNNCVDCHRSCATCQVSEYGQCDSCIHPSYTPMGEYCGCTEGLLDTGSQCVSLDQGCPQGEFIKHSKCVACQANCLDCEDETGNCLTCQEGYEVLSDNGKCVPVQGQCVFEYGPKDNPAGCLQQRYSEKRLIPPYAINAPYVDWREWGIINPIRSQGGCGSCYSFAAASVVEPAYAIMNGRLPEVSEQQIVDCDRRSGGCGGGWMSDNFEFWKEHGTISRENYPYISGSTATPFGCQQDGKPRDFYWTSDIPSSNVGDEKDWPIINGTVSYSKETFFEALRQQPVAVGMGIGRLFKLYRGGIFTDDQSMEGSCDLSKVGHAMSAVGYGYDVESQTEYVIIRNSWNTWWGEDGYARVAVGDVKTGGTCFLYARGVYPNV